MHFKYSAKMSEEIEEGAHTAALKAYYPSGTNHFSYLSSHGIFSHFSFKKQHLPTHGIILK